MELTIRQSKQHGDYLITSKDSPNMVMTRAKTEPEAEKLAAEINAFIGSIKHGFSDASLLSATELAQGKNRDSITEQAGIIRHISLTFWATDGVDYLGLHNLSDSLEYIASELQTRENKWINHSMIGRTHGKLLAESGPTMTIRETKKALEGTALYVKDISGPTSYGYAYTIFIGGEPSMTGLQSYTVRTDSKYNGIRGFVERFYKQDVELILQSYRAAQEAMPDFVYQGTKAETRI